MSGSEGPACDCEFVRCSHQHLLDQFPKTDAAIFRGRTFHLRELGDLFHLYQVKVERGSERIALPGEVQTIQLWVIHCDPHAHDPPNVPLAHCENQVYP
jgi:hypothetical protein